MGPCQLDAEKGGKGEGSRRGMSCFPRTAAAAREGQAGRREPWATTPSSELGFLWTPLPAPLLSPGASPNPQALPPQLAP